MFQPIRSTLSSDTSLVILCWSSRVSQTSFLGGTSSGRPFSGQQTINIKIFNTLFFCWGIFSQLQRVLQTDLFPQKNLKYKNLKTRTICRMNFCIVCVCSEFENSVIALRCHWANEADFWLKAFKQMFLKERMIEP